MFSYRLYLCALLALALGAQAQRARVIKPVKTHARYTKLGIGVGVTNSAVFLARNTTEHNDAIGLHTSLVYEGSRLFRVTLEYTHYGVIDISPTWYNIHANTLESNIHIMYKSKSSNLYFYPLFGLSYNIFKGYFTGKDDYLNLKSIHQPNEEVTTRWLGLNAGVGLEYQIKPIVIFGTFKMRVGVSEGNKELNILDVCYTAGIRWNLRVPSFYSLFRGTRNRYFLDAKEE